MQDHPQDGDPGSDPADHDSWPALEGGGEYDAPSEVPSAAPQTRLCPHCEAITDFKDGHCARCGRASMATGDPPPFDLAPVEAPPGLMKFVLIGLGLLLLAAVAFFIVPMFLPDKGAAPGPAPTASGDGDGAGFVGTLDTVALDEQFHADVTAAVQQANADLKTAARDAYIYRYNAAETTVPATSQIVLLTVYAAGRDADTVAADGGDATVQGAFAGLLDRLNQRAGVEASLEVRSTGGAESADPDDRYVIYGEYFGREHMTELQPIIDGIENYRAEFGQYPQALTGSVVSGVKTKGGVTFMSNGVGYIPLYATDSAGNIKMGSGTGLARYTPEKVTGYYLLRFLESPGTGIDMYSADDETYYVNHIAPFPYQPPKPVHNMQFHPDGKPDGIGAVIQNGKVLDRNSGI
jgi:hypothetical protein